jgi:hypothetical protein
MYYYTALLITVSLQLATRHFGKYLVALGTNLFFWETHLGVFGASPRSFGWHLGGPRSQPLSLCDAPPNLGESLAGGALLGVLLTRLIGRRPDEGQATNKLLQKSHGILNLCVL